MASPDSAEQLEVAETTLSGELGEGERLLHSESASVQVVEAEAEGKKQGKANGRSISPPVEPDDITASYEVS